LLSAWITNDLPAYQTFANWQIANFGSSNAANGGPEEDYDGDRACNYLEYLTATAPTNAQSFWTIQAQLLGGSVQIVLPQIANRGFEVQSADGSVNALSWSPLDAAGNEPFFVSSNRMNVVTDPISGATNRFYRVRVFEP
jgi:hypothetical protein